MVNMKTIFLQFFVYNNQIGIYNNNILKYK